MDKKKLEVWKETLGKITFLQLLRTECKISPDIQWKKMFVAAGDVKMESLKCALCETAVISKILCIRQHILGKKHVRKMELSVAAIRHPNINPFKVTTRGAGPTNPANANNKEQTNVPLKSAQGNNKQPANQNTQKLGTAANLANPSNQTSGTAARPANQNNPGIAPKPASQINPNPETAPKPASQINPKPGTAPKPASQINPKPKTAPKPASQINPKPETAPKPANPENQNDGTASKPANQNNLKPGIAPKPANTDNQNAGSASKPANENNQKLDIAPKSANQSNQKPGIVSKPANQNTQKSGTTLKLITENNQTQQNVANNAAKILNKANQDSEEVKQELTDTVSNPQQSTGTKQGPKINLLNKKSTSSEAGTSKSANENINTLNVNPLALGMIAQESIEKEMESFLNTTDQTKQNTLNDNADKPSNLVINPVSLLTQKELVKSGKHLKDIMKNFELKDLMVIEFRYAGFQWRPMFKKLPDGAFKCLLCGTYILKNLDDLRQHNDSVRHATSINAVEKIFHPNLAPTKDKNDHGPAKKKKMEEPDFRIHLPDLSLEEIKKVEYFFNEKWAPLIHEAADVIQCNLCNATSILTYTALVDHLMSRAHLGNLSHVDKLFHPTLTHDKPTLESKIKNKNLSQPTSNPPGTPSVICIEDSPEREIEDSNSRDRDEDLTNILAILNEERKETATVDVPVEEPKKLVNPVAILAQSNKKITVIQNKDRIMPRPQFRPLQSVQTFSMMCPPFPVAPIMPPMQQPIFGLNQSEHMLAPPDVVVPSTLPINPRQHHHDPKFSNKNLTSRKMEEIEGFIGIEYVVKVVRNANDNMPRYECCLCEIESDGLGMQLHLKGLLHRRKFLERHFPTAMRQFSKYRDNVKYAPAMTQICEKLAISIEKYHGRDLPYECLDDEFRSNRDRVMSKVFSFRHASEHSGPSFINVIDKKMLDEYISKNNYMMPEADTNRIITFDPRHVSAHKRQREASPPPLDVEQHKRLVEKFLENTTLPHSKRRSSYGRSPTRSTHHHRKNSPRKSSSKKSSFGSSEEWDSYMRMFDHAVKDLDNDYDEYKKDPEKHPMYDDEWKKYWVRKSKSLRNVGIDPSTYNFQPGWVRFFSRRVHQMYDNAVEEIRRNLRERLGLPHHNENLSDIKYHIGVLCVDPINDEGDLLEKEDLELAREQNELGDYSMELPSELLDEGKSEDITKMDTPEDEADQSGDDLESETYNMVPVLRLLTALEDQLGSLGPKVNDLLSKALTLEKVKPNSSDENLITPENCVFLETVTEKLKGQVLAGMIVGNKLKAVKQAIRDLGSLLKMASKILSNRPKVQEPPKEVKMPTVQKRPARPTGSSEQPSKKQCLDKEEIASKLAAALAAQGKTDFSSEQLEQLVVVYTLIEKKRRETVANKKPDILTEQQEKSLSETLLDFLKPNAEGVPTKQAENKSQSFYSNKQIPQSSTTSGFNKNVANTNRMDSSPSNSFNPNIQNRLQRSSIPLSDNFSQLRQFNTSLNISSLNRNSSVSQSWGNNTNSMQQFSNMNATQESFRQGSSFMNPMNPNQNQSRLDHPMISNPQSNSFNYYQNQSNRGFNTNEMPALRNQGSNQSFMNEFSQRQLSSNVPVMTSNSMMRGGGNKNANNPPMVSYPQANVRPNQRSGNFHSNMMQKDQIKPPMGWQRNNAGRR